MLTVAVVSLFVGPACCYSAGIVLGWLLSNIQSSDFGSFRANIESDSAKRLRIEVRDNVSRIILEALEQGDVPTQHDMMKSCPAHLRTGKAKILWQRESQLMLNRILPQSLTEPLSSNSKKLPESKI